MPRSKITEPIATVGIDIGKNTFDLIGLDRTGRSWCTESCFVTSLPAALSTFRLA